MPIKKSLMASLKKRFGAEKGREVYVKMEAEGTPPFSKKKVKHG